jgi:hypothetical protein
VAWCIQGPTDGLAWSEPGERERAGSADVPGPLLELITLQCRKQTHKTQKILTRHFLLIKRVEACVHSHWATRKHKMAGSGSSLYPWLRCTCPSPGICPGKRFTVSLDWLKGLGGWVRVCSLAGNGVVQESRRRSKDPLNMQVTEDGDLRHFKVI